MAGVARRGGHVGAGRAMKRAAPSAVVCRVGSGGEWPAAVWPAENVVVVGRGGPAAPRK